MKMALAQINVRLGDIEGACARIASQAALAARQGANLLCTPSPLFGGMQPTTLIDYPNYEHDLLRGLAHLAQTMEPLDIDLLVPAIIQLDQVPLAEAFLLREGRVVPMRSTMAVRAGRVDATTWEPAVFETAGTRVAVVFDLERDMAQLPRGCDVAVHFQMSGFNEVNEESAGIAAVADGHFSEEAARHGVWFAYMAPVGAYDETVFTGGSFIMDDSGRVVAFSPSFEEDLLVQDVSRGVSVPTVDEHELPRYFREEWIWEALRLFVKDTVSARGFGRVVIPLEGDLPTSLLAVLAVDALGSRNVVGVSFERPDVYTPKQEAEETERLELIRELTANLGIRLIERAQGDVSRWMDRDVPAADAGRLRIGIDALYLADVAHEMSACTLSALTKTDAALAPAMAVAGGAAQAVAAPFGDVYLTELEFLARYRSRTSAVIPAAAASLSAVAQRMGEILAGAIESCHEGILYTERIAQLLATIEPTQVDGTLEAHVDRNCVLEDLPLFNISPEAAAVLLMLVRRGESERRSLPMAPAVSARSFAERAWPASLGWSDIGRRGEDVLNVIDLAREGIKRFETLGEEHGERVRGEIMGLLGNLLGISPDQIENLASEENQRRLRESAERFEEHLRQMLGSQDGDRQEQDGADASGQHGQASGWQGGNLRNYPFFSQN